MPQFFESKHGSVLLGDGFPGDPIEQRERIAGDKHPAGQRPTGRDRGCQVYAQQQSQKFSGFHLVFPDGFG